MIIGSGLSNGLWMWFSVKFGSGLSGYRMGMGDPEINCEGCLLGLWWIDGDGSGMW